jgi:hypothetical protein
MRVRCDRCSTVYEWHDDGVDWAKDCPVCGQLAAWLTPTPAARREHKEPPPDSSPGPFGVTAPVRPDAARIPITCPPPSGNVDANRWDTPPYSEGARPAAPKAGPVVPSAGDPWPTPPYMETVPPALPDEPVSLLDPRDLDPSVPSVDIDIDIDGDRPSDVDRYAEILGDTERPHVHPSGGAPPPRSVGSGARSGWIAFAAGAALAAAMMGIYLGRHPEPRGQSETATLTGPRPIPAPLLAPAVLSARSANAESEAPAPEPPAPVTTVLAPPAAKAVSAKRRDEAACCGSAVPRAIQPAGRRGAILRQALVARCKGEHVRARSLYESILDAAPSDPDALTGLGDVARDEDDWGGAREYYSRALRRAPSFLPALLGAADVEWEVANFAVAQQKYRDIVDRLPSTAYPPRVTQRAADARGLVPGRTD